MREDVHPDLPRVPVGTRYERQQNTRDSERQRGEHRHGKPGKRAMHCATAYQSLLMMNDRYFNKQINVS
ncbi:hypothetical protein AB2N04_06850 [Nitratireductor sp. GISD-1A_MAKvit]|uniref:hypothetical protein n=1 Tax=Nitratireductor sp. GISD-1A_MAKvit TaxID=3234198 RepID=UPI003466712F